VVVVVVAAVAARIPVAAVMSPVVEVAVGAEEARLLTS